MAKLFFTSNTRCATPWKHHAVAQKNSPPLSHPVGEWATHSCRNLSIQFSFNPKTKRRCLCRTFFGSRLPSQRSQRREGRTLMIPIKCIFPETWYWTGMGLGICC